MSLTLDHFNIVLPSKMFDESQKLLSLFKCSQSYKTEVAHGSWEGLYLFPKYGALVEFLREDKTHHLNDFGISFCSAISKEKMSEYLPQSFPYIDWETNSKTYSDGTHWFDSTKPKEQDSQFFFWVMDFSKRGKNRRENFGSDTENNFISLQHVKLEVPSNIHSKLEDLVFWTPPAKNKLENEKTFTFSQINGDPLKFSFFPQKDKNVRQFSFEFMTTTPSKFEVDVGKHLKFKSNKENIIISMNIPMTKT